MPTPNNPEANQPPQKNINIEIELDIDQPYYNEVPGQGSIDIELATLKPQAQASESGQFASTQYHIECAKVNEAPEDTIWRKTNFDQSTPLYIYTPRGKVALMMHVLNEKKINYVINDYTLSDSQAKGRTLCHFFTGGLTVLSLKKCLDLLC